MIIRRECNPLDAASKVINLQEGCLRYIWIDRASNNARVDEMIKELKIIRKIIDKIRR